jgi:hypothetical protein
VRRYGPAGGMERYVSHGNNNVHLEANQLSRKGGKSIRFPICKTAFNNNVFSFNVSELTQSLL